MYFKRIEMHGFKSFAEPVTIEFDDGITCIVGPNGSGKSNISDAVRWVLGEQSPKMLRGGKMEEVIFAGTENRKSRGMAEVTLVMDNTTGILPIDYNEVAITRRMYRSGESEYSINNNQCRLRDIRELIMDTGIGVDGYSLIGQGKISDIISNKTESRREIFEEAAGIVMYRTKKADAERKLRSTKDNLERVNDIVGEIEGRIDGLKEDSIKAQEYIELRDRLKDLEINITLKNIENIELKSEYIKDDLMELADSIENKKTEKTDIDKDLAESRQRSENLEQLSNEARDKLLAGVEEINKLVNEEQLAGERLAAISKNSSRLTSEIEQLRERAAREKENSKGIFERKDQMDGEASRLNGELDQKVEEHSRLTAEAAEMTDTIDQSKNKIFSLHSIISSKQAEIKSMDNLAATLESRKKQITDEKSRSEGDNRDTLDSLNRIKAERKSIEEDLERAGQQRKELKEKYGRYLLQERDLSKKAEDFKISAGQLSARKKTIEEMESNYEGYNRAVKFIMKENLSGIEGVVAELIDVPQGMEVAVETALGGALQNIVCEDDRSAKTAVSVLKRNNAGRLTFLPVRSMKANPVTDSRIERATGFKGYGTDCVKFKDKYRPVMEYLLGRVVVVDNMDNAVAMSKSGVRGLKYVTLDGEIINAGGAITGGRYKNKTANLLERKAEVAELEKRLAELIRKRDEAAEELETLRRNIEASNSKISELEEACRSGEMELFAKDSIIKNTEASLTDFKSSSEKWDSELGRIETEQQGSAELVAKLRGEVKEAEEAIVSLGKTIEEEQGRYDSKKAEVEEASERITKARIAVGAFESEKSNIDELVGRINKTLQEIGDDIERREKELADLQSEKETLSFDHTDIEDIVKEKEEIKANLEGYVEELSRERSELTAHINEISAIKDSSDEELSALQSQKYELEIKQAKQETQLDGLKDKLWEDFEISYLRAIDFKKEDFVMAPAVKESRSIKARMRELGEVNIGSIKEYASVSERYEFLTAQRDDILESMDSLQKIIDDMDKTIKAKFKESFDQVVVNFEEVFKSLFGGGHAQLQLEDEGDPLESPIEIIAQPPGKALKNINLLSGGEKSMTAIALMFAVLKTKPTPFCILDEVEAALDDANIDRFARYLKTSFDDIQFTLVTHKKATMEYADALYGVTMPERGISKILSLKLGEEFEGAEA